MSISVIIPVFNGAGFIESSYQEICEQNIRDFELLYVDNNSTDNSRQLILDLTNRDSRVKLLEERTQGAASARNKGVEHAKGRYIYFFDVDDQIYQGAINALFTSLETNPEVDSVFGNTIRSNTRLGKNKQPQIKEDYLDIFEPPKLGVQWLNYALLPGTPSMLHKKEVFEKLGGFNPQLLLGEDAAFLVKLGLECKIAHLNRDILHYYRHPNSTVSIQNKSQIPKVFTYWEPLVKEHIPYLKHKKAPLKYRMQVQKNTYGYLGKMLVLTQGYRARARLYNLKTKEMEPIKVPVLLKLIYEILILTGSSNLYKVLVYYVIPWILKYKTIK